MTETEPEQQEQGQFYDAPNQQVVRADGSGPADEGTGGEYVDPAGQPEEPPPEEPGPQAMSGQPTAADLDAMTKEELLAYARELGLSPANNDMSKSELRAGIDAQLGR